MKSFSRLRDETTVVQFNFLITDIAVGQTFLDVAETTQNPTTRARNLQNANAAHAAVSRLSGRVSMTAAQGLEFDEKLKGLGDRINSMNLPR